MRLVGLVVVLAVLCFAGGVHGETIEEYDARLERELAAIDRDALAVWQKANAAREARQHDEASKLYAEVYRRVPSFVHALRRQGGEEHSAGRRAQAIELLRTAVKIDRSSENLTGLARALSETAEGNPSKAELDEARSLAGEAARKAPKEPYPAQVLAMIAAQSNDLEALRSATATLERVAPRDPGTHYFRSIVAASDGSWNEARAAIDQARDLGLPEEAHASMVASFDEAMPFSLRWQKPLLIGFASWFGGFAILLAAGAILSRVAVRAARRPPVTATGSATGLGSPVRRIYAAVLSLSCVFYYLSIPVVMLTVVGIGGGLLWAMLAAGRVPVKLLLIVVVLVLVTLWSMIKSLFIRVKDEDPGMRLDLRAEPRLRALLDSVAKRIGTRPVDNVYITPGTEVAVMERGKRNVERCLILGVAALDGLRIRPLKAVLGHEYGHFTNRDTAGGAFALSVRRSLRATAFGLAEGGVATWYNPAWWFVNGFNRVFLRISEGASRLQEMLADRWAAFAYGADAFEEGLRHVVERSVRFDAHVGATLRQVVDQKLPLTNLYTFEPSEATEDVATAVNEALNRKASAYDSHPAPMERFEILRALPIRSRRVEPDDDAPAWSLFASPQKLQQAMTDQIRANVAANYGVEIEGAVA